MTPAFLIGKVQPCPTSSAASFSTLNLIIKQSLNYGHRFESNQLLEPPTNQISLPICFSHPLIYPGSWFLVSEGETKHFGAARWVFFCSLTNTTKGSWHDSNWTQHTTATSAATHSTPTNTDVQNVFSLHNCKQLVKNMWVTSYLWTSLSPKHWFVLID